MNEALTKFISVVSAYSTLSQSDATKTATETSDISFFLATTANKQRIKQWKIGYLNMIMDLQELAYLPQ